MSGKEVLELGFGRLQSPLSRWLLMNAKATDPPQHGHSAKAPLALLSRFSRLMLRLPSHRSILFKKLPPTQESPTMHFTDFSAQESYCS